MDKFCRHFETAIPKLRRQILAKFKSHHTQAGFRSVWEHFEDVINPILISFLTNSPLSIPRSDIKEPPSKSTYPDLKVSYRNNMYAIDVKSGEYHKNPWYDIGRLATYEEKRLSKYKAEYSVVVRWRGRNPIEVVDVYIEPTYRTIGYRAASNGVLYRPYDGKIRPKPWAEFEAGTSHWKNEEHFKRGLESSLNYWRMSYIAEWYKGMDKVQQQKVKRILVAIDVGEAVELDKVSADEDALGS
ncbi:MAG TPA: hypothetical protein VKB86_05565 [Pyrinomonadaceae bacterium]|nr:hypothetical protein [Pyrinomonadaceae bacterium]